MATWVWAVADVTVVAVIALVAVRTRKHATALFRRRFGLDSDRAGSTATPGGQPSPT